MVGAPNEIQSHARSSKELVGRPLEKAHGGSWERFLRGQIGRIKVRTRLKLMPPRSLAALPAFEPSNQRAPVELLRTLALTHSSLGLHPCRGVPWGGHGRKGESVGSRARH